MPDLVFFWNFFSITITKKTFIIYERTHTYCRCYLLTKYSFNHGFAVFISLASYLKKGGVTCSIFFFVKKGVFKIHFKGSFKNNHFIFDIRQNQGGEGGGLENHRRIWVIF